MAVKREPSMSKVIDGLARRARQGAISIPATDRFKDSPEPDPDNDKLVLTCII